MVPAKANGSMPAFPNMPALPQMFQATMPPPVPQINFKGGIVKNFFHNRKLEQIEHATKQEALIAENHLRQVQAKFGAIMELLTFGQKYQLEVARLNSELRMLQINEQKAEAELIGLQLANMEKQYDAKIAELDYKTRLKEWNNGAAEAEIIDL